MKKISFNDVLPHIVAVAAFLLVTILFFRPVFFDNMALNQADIQQFLWSSKELRDFREVTGEEGLWADRMFSGMPAYMINTDWSDGIVTTLKRIFSFYLPHPVNNIFLAFLSYYIMLLAFRVRPYLAIAGAIAFGLSSYMLVGIMAGHNARVGSIAFMPLVMAGVHLVFTNKKLLGFAVTALGMAFHLRENHLQITYYLMFIVGVYGIVQLARAVKEKKVPEFAKTVGLIVVAVVIAVGTFFGQMWAATELSKYSHRGASELTSNSKDAGTFGLPKSYAFAYSNGILEPMTLLIPNFYGGASSNVFVTDENSNTYKALMGSGDQQLVNQLARYSSAYWGPQPLATPYYASAIIVFLFVLGIAVADKKYVWWLVPVSILSIMMSWGSSFASFNYFLFDYFPGYNKFRSVTFSLVIIFFSMPLLGMLGLEKLLQNGIDKETKKKLWIAFGVTGGLCALLFLVPGILSFTREVEEQMPVWFQNALKADRKALLRADAFRSFAFIAAIFILLFFNVPKRISAVGFFAFLAFMVAIDLSTVDSRFFTKENNYMPKAQVGNFAPQEVDARILRDTTYYRMVDLNNFYQAFSSNFHNSLGGYSGVRLKRYQELIDSAILIETEQIFEDAQAGPLNMRKYGVLNMLNTKYLIYGTEANNVLLNNAANGNAWFPSEITTVNSANEELKKITEIDTRRVAVIDKSKVKLTNSTVNTDSAAYIRFISKIPYRQRYESQSTSGGLGVFSEIYYPVGWTATIDGNETPILRVDYTLRGLEIPAGKHIIEFTFQPAAYVIGNKVTLAMSVLLLVVVIGALFLELREKA
ncbi:MAG TPA: YfhO family protein [Cyclobacteriaceae bacterium]|nr:YfhO family protein [Cyclobacteriaceae bacterium]